MNQLLSKIEFNRSYDLKEIRDLGLDVNLFIKSDTRESHDLLGTLNLHPSTYMEGVEFEGSKKPSVFVIPKRRILTSEEAKYLNSLRDTRYKETCAGDAYFAYQFEFEDSATAAKYKKQEEQLKEAAEALELLLEVDQENIFSHILWYLKNEIGWQEAEKDVDFEEEDEKLNKLLQEFNYRAEKDDFDYLHYSLGPFGESYGEHISNHLHNIRLLRFGGKNKEGKTIKLIDFNKPENNQFEFQSQYNLQTFAGKRIIDLAFIVNQIVVLTIEYSPNRSIEDCYNQLKRYYREGLRTSFCDIIIAEGKLLVGEMGYSLKDFEEHDFSVLKREEALRQIFEGNNFIEKMKNDSFFTIAE